MHLTAIEAVRDQVGWEHGIEHAEWNEWAAMHNGWIEKIAADISEPLDHIGIERKDEDEYRRHFF